MRHDVDLELSLRDGTRLLVDVFRPDAPGSFPALVAASPYPRQIQDLGAPLGMIEAGASDFFVPRGYVHVLVNLRGTGGSNGVFGFFDEGERRDLYDAIEWVAAQPWCDGNVGGVGISYFAMTQVEAAVEQPPHLKAIFPLSATPDLYEAVYHNGLFSSGFLSSFIDSIGVLAANSSKREWRGALTSAARAVLRTPRLHSKFAHLNGESTAIALRPYLPAPRQPEPWDELWQNMAVEHQQRDEYWDNRSVIADLEKVGIPAYLGCDWPNVALHLPGAFECWTSMTRNGNHDGHVRLTILGEYGLTWPWESLHVEALAWFDHWLKGKDTGILDGPPVRYWLPGAEEWRTAADWPPPATHHTWHLGSNGRLTAQTEPNEPGQRSYVCLGTDAFRPPSHALRPPSFLTWESDPIDADLDVVGEIELRLVASSTASDTAWIVQLRDVAPDGTIVDVTSGWLRASFREVDEAASRPGAPDLPCRTPVAVPIGERVDYRIPLVPNARRFAAGHRIQLTISSDDQPDDFPVMGGFRHAPVGTSAHNTVFAESQLWLPVLASTNNSDPRSHRGAS